MRRPAAGAMIVALHEPDIPQNTAAILRTAACFGVAVHIVGPAAFDLSDRAVRRAGLDYAPRVPLTRHPTFASFRAAVPGRLVLLTTRGDIDLDSFDFVREDVLLFGAESAGVPNAVHAAADVRVRIPLAEGMRSLNLATAVGIALWQALVSSGALAGATRG